MFCWNGGPVPVSVCTAPKPDKSKAKNEIDQAVSLPGSPPDHNASSDVVGTKLDEA